MAQDQRHTLYGWISTGFMGALMTTGLVAACNTNPVTFLSSTGAIQGKIETSISKQSQMDILWVVDNSGSMCQEQKVLRDNFDQFIDVLKDTSLDFHLAVTTTHAPSADTPVVTEPVAEEARIQSTPQPVPGFDPTCIADSNGGFAPLRGALEGALECLADESQKGQYNWSDEQIKCAREGIPANCGMTLNIPDRNGDANISIEDLFPAPSDYRPLPKVLKSEAYRLGDGTLDVPKLKRDFGCMSLVGTRGDGFERGLQAAVEAVSPELTGFAEGAETADPTKPNHGFIRKDASFTLVFVTDENDCSAKDKTAIPAISSCEADICDFENSSLVSSEDSKLVPVEELAEQFRKNLSETKGREVTEAELLMASIHGSFDRFDEPIPSNTECESLERKGREAKLIACSSPELGNARSGDRYERFIRQFSQYFPNSASKKDPLNFDLVERGWICAGNFAPALIAIAEFIRGIDPGCVTDRVLPCEIDEECPAQLYSGKPGACIPVPGTDSAQKFCDSGIVLQISLEDEVGAQFPDITTNPYCVPESVGKLRTKAQACIVDPAKYIWQGCAATTGLSFQWTDPIPQVSQQLSGYKLELIYNATVGGDEAEAQ